MVEGFVSVSNYSFCVDNMYYNIIVDNSILVMHNLHHSPYDDNESLWILWHMYTKSLYPES